MKLEIFVQMQTKKLKIAMDTLALIAEFGEEISRKKAIDAITEIDPQGHSPWKRWVKK